MHSSSQYRCGGLTLVGGAVRWGALLGRTAPLRTATAGAARALLTGGGHLFQNTHAHYCQSPHPTTGPPTPSKPQSHKQVIDEALRAATSNLSLTCL